MGMIKQCWLQSNGIFRIEVPKDEIVTKLLVLCLLIFRALAVCQRFLVGELQTICMGSKFGSISSILWMFREKPYDMCCVCDPSDKRCLGWTAMFAGDTQTRKSCELLVELSHFRCPQPIDTFFVPLQKFHNQQVYKIPGRSDHDIVEHVTLLCLFYMKDSYACCSASFLGQHILSTNHPFSSFNFSISPSLSQSCKVAWPPGWSVGVVYNVLYR